MKKKINISDWLNGTTTKAPVKRSKPKKYVESEAVRKYREERDVILNKIFPG